MNSTHTLSPEQSRAKPWTIAVGLLAMAIAALTVALILPANAQTAAASAQRFQISAFGFGGPSANGQGAYVVDTFTGEVWVVSERGATRKVNEKLK